MNGLDTLEDKLKKFQETYAQATEYFELNHDQKKALEAYKLLKIMLSGIKEDVIDIRKEIGQQRQLLLAANATPVVVDKIDGNIDNKGEAPQLAGVVETKKSGLLSDDLEMLTKRLVEGKLKFNKDKYDESIKARQDHLARSFAQGKFWKGLVTMPGIKTRKSVGEIIGSVAKDSKVLKRLQEKEIKFSSESKFYRSIKNVRKEQKKKKGSSFMGTAARIIAGKYINNLIDTVKGTIDKAVTVAKGTIASTQAGRKLINESTRISDDLHEFGASASSKINSGIKFTTKIIKGGYDVVAVGGKVVTSAVNSLVPAAAVYILLGANPAALPIAVGYLGVSTGIKTYLKILDDPNLSSIKPIREAQIKYGRGIFYDQYGRIKLDSLNVENADSILNKTVGADQKLLLKRFESQKLLGRLDSRVMRVVSSVDAVVSWAPIGAVIGGMLGVSPIIGGVIGGLGGLGIRAISNAIKGGSLPFKGAMGTLAQSSALRTLAEVPFTEFVGQYQTNLWFGMQIDMIKNRYHGDVGKYLKDNWDPFVDSNIFKTVTVLSNILQVGGAGLAIGSGITGTFMINRAADLFARFAAPGPRVFITRAGAAGFTAANLIGTAVGIGVAMLLGIPLGPAMLLGATIGGVVGTIAGIGISALVTGTTFGTLSWTSFAITIGTTSLGSLIGSWIGSFFDKAAGFTGGMMMGFMQGMLAIFQILALLAQKISFDNIMPVALGLITLMSTLYRMGVFDISNQCLENEYCPASSTSTSLDNQPNLLELKAYGVYLITPQDVPVNSDTMAMVTNYLEKSGKELQNKFGNKKIFINLTGSESFSDDKFVILGIDTNSNIPMEGLSNALDESIKKSVNAQISNETNYAFLNVQ